MKSTASTVARCLVLFAATAGISTDCLAGVAGSSYAGNGGVVQIDFKPGGKAYIATGPVSTLCSYSESGRTVTLVCEGDKTVFKIDDDGALIGPPDGLLGRLTLKK